LKASSSTWTRTTSHHCTRSNGMPGNLRIAEVNIGEILKAQVAARLKALG
jgi:hypothetical protein